jgi:hypothetical protein
MQKRTTLAAAAGLVLALGAPLVASIPANAAPAPASSSTVTKSHQLFTPFVRTVDGQFGEVTNTEDGSDADIFSFAGHAATRTAEVVMPGLGGRVHVEQRLADSDEWNEIDSFDLLGQLASHQLQVTVPEADGYAEYRMYATNDEGDRTDSRTFFVVEY